MKTVWVRIILAVVVLCLAAAVLRVHVSGRSALESGRAALDAGDLQGAQNHFLTAGRWYVPLTGLRDEAVENLLAIGESYYEEGDYRAATAAFDDARGALYSSASLVPPDEALLAEADDGLARSLARWKSESDPRHEFQEEYERYLATARSIVLPSPWWSLLMGLSFLGYVGLLGFIAWNWGKKAGRSKRIWAATGVSFALWLLSLTQI